MAIFALTLVGLAHTSHACTSISTHGKYQIQLRMGMRVRMRMCNTNVNTDIVLLLIHLTLRYITLLTGIFLPFSVILIFVIP